MASKNNLIKKLNAKNDYFSLYSSEYKIDNQKCKFK